jgi:phosphoribosylanthranilate isomerase
MAAEAGADYVGVVLTESPRRVSVETGAAIRAALPGETKLVAVFADEPPDAAGRAARAVQADVVQVAGWDEDEASGTGLEIWRVIRAQALPDPDALAMVPLRTYLLDAHDPRSAGGTGKRADWDWAKRCVDLGRRLVVAGGLTPENVASLVLEVRPFGVDASSGLESSVGRKSPDRVRDFIARVRAADEERPKRS